MKFQDWSPLRGLPTSKFVTRVFLPLSAIVAACTPDVGDPEFSTSDKVIVNFDPSNSIVPAPNDLAKNRETGKLVVPSKETDTAAQKEFNADYLGTLNGFPFGSSASVGITGQLDPASVTDQAVFVLDVNTFRATGNADAARIAVTGLKYDNNVISFGPPQGGWKRATTYAVVIVANATGGIKGANGLAVSGSPTWALVSATAPLVTCTDQAQLTGCRPAVDIIPSAVRDNPTARLADQTASATRLEQIRLGYAPILDAFATRGIGRENIPIAWTFTAADAGEITFDPATSVIPFPNDVVRQGEVDTLSQQKKVTTPNPTNGQPLTAADCAAAAASGNATVSLYCGLNTLDGFSTLAPLVSENSDTLAAASQATLAAASLTPATVGLVPLATGLPAGAASLRTEPKWTPCLNCTSSLNADGSTPTSPQQLQWKLDVPLDERSTYGAYVTTDVKDDKGMNVMAAPSFALVRSKAPLVVDGKSQVSVLSDEQAARLEPLRAGLTPFFDALEAKGLKRSSLALGYAFTTQSESSVLDRLQAGIKASATLPDIVLAAQDVTGPTKAAMGAAGAPTADIGNIYAGYYYTPVAVTGPSGTLDPANPRVVAIPYTIFFPANDATGTTIFGHGLTRSRNDVIAIANTVAKTGQAVIATDVLDHGDRTTCTGARSVLPAGATDDNACNASSRCDGDPLIGLCVSRAGARAACTPGPQGDGACLAQGQGRCAADSQCQGAGAGLALNAGGAPVVSGWNMFSLTNFFATRDNFRQQVIDLTQLVRVLKATGTNSLSGRIGATDPVNATNINYVGQSLGGILGTLFNSVSPDTNNVALNVPGGALPQIILTSPGFAAQRTALTTVLAAQGRPVGSPGFDTFINVAQWILDPADPANMAYRLTHSADTGTGPAPNANRKAYIQFIEGDQVVPNVSNFALVRGANRSFVDTAPSFGCQAPLFCYEYTEAVNGFTATSATPATRHGFLLSPPAGGGGGVLTLDAQTKVGTFLATGAVN